MATDQAVELVPPEGDCWAGRLGRPVYKLALPLVSSDQERPAFRFKHRGVIVNGEIVSHGNVFVMTNLPMGKHLARIW